MAVDTIEHMFEHERVFGAPVSVAPPPDRVRELQARIHHMQTPRLDVRTIPTHPVIAELLPEGGIRQGAVYSVAGSALLLLALLAPPSAAGAWCAAVGMPDLGLEAARDAGIDLERLVLVPRPAEHWMTVVASLADIMGVLALRPPAQANESTVARLSARLRQQGTTLFVQGAWPHTEGMISVDAPRWHGLGHGHGQLVAREVTVTVTNRTSGRPRSARLWLPGEVAPLARVAEAAREHRREAPVPIATAV